MSDTCATTRQRSPMRRGPARVAFSSTDGRELRARAATVPGLSWVEITALVLILAALVVGVSVTRTRARDVTSRVQVRVQRGETLWSIAHAHPVIGQTTAQTADTIARLNGLSTADVQIGERLLVPAVVSDRSLASR